ncbi:MAG TPA: response regulator [Gemmatimonadales bacterium]|nr:response regulator [Gemmatimonadales bacterium]
MPSDAAPPDGAAERILLVAPTGRDAELLAATLSRSGFQTDICPGMPALAESVAAGGAVAVIAEEALETGADQLEAVLAAQPSWSDLPIIVLLSPGATLASSRALLSRFDRHGNVTLLERPVRTVAWTSTVQAALRARHRQYEVRDHLRQLAIAQVALERSEARYRSLALASASIVWLSDADGVFRGDGTTWGQYTGQTAAEYAGWGWLDAIHPEDREPAAAAWRRAVERKEAYYAEYRLQRYDGQYRRVTSRGVPVLNAEESLVEWVGACTDVEDERRAADHLRQAQRIEAVGSLAGGLAHEVNNMMTAVIGFGGFVLKGLPEDHKNRSDVSEMVKAATRAAGVTRQLLAFTRQQVLQPTVLDLNLVVTDLTRMLSGFLGADVELNVRLDPQIGRVRADRGQLEQVIINLALNARYAMKSGGRLTLMTALVQLDEAYARRHPGTAIEPGPYVALSVTDTGEGMDPATRARAFEPFFTTKPVGQGTGLGLSTAYGIVKQSGGYIWLYSEHRKGTSVKVYLPQVGDALSRPSRPLVAPRGQGETILVVEDEEAVRTLARRTLEEAGYDVLEAANGREALRRVLSDPVDMVLCDVILPEMSGHELGRRMAAVRPDVPVLYMSGYPGLEVVERGLIAHDAPFIEKPFTAAGLAQSVRGVLTGVRLSPREEHARQ